MKAVTLAWSVLGLVMATPAAAVSIFTASMDGSQIVPANGSTATGTATLTLNDAQTELAYDIVIEGLDFNGNNTLDANDDIIGLHIHLAPPGVNGPIIFGIHGPQHDLDDRAVSFPSTSSVRFTGAWDAADAGANNLADHLGDLQDGDLYLAAHTPPFPSGEIRGQIVPEPGTALLFGLGLAGLAAVRRGSGAARSAAAGGQS